MPADNYKAVPPALSKLFPGVDVRLDLDMDSLGDQSGYGQPATPTYSVVKSTGVYGKSSQFPGSTGAGYINCAAAASLNITSDITLAAWLRSSDNATNQYMISKTAFPAGYALMRDATMLRLLTTAWYNIAVPNNVGSWRYYAGSIKGAVYRLFDDGLQVARGACTAPNTALAVSAYIGSFGSPQTVNGSLDQPIICAQALSPEQIYRLYQAASARPLFYDSFQQYPVDFAARSAGAECGPFRIYSGTAQVTVDAAGKKWVQVASVPSVNYKQSEQAYGTWEWDFVNTVNSDFLCQFISSVPGPYNVSAAQNGYVFHVNITGSCILYRVTAGAVTGLIATAIGTVVLGTAYRVRIVRRIGGSISIYLLGGVYTDWTSVISPVVDNNHTTSMFFNAWALTVTGQKISNIKQWLTCRRPESSPWEFVAGSGTSADLVSGTTIWRRQLTAGLLFLSKDLDYQQGRVGFRTVVEGIYKSAGTTHDTLLATEILSATTATQNCYTIRITATGRCQFLRSANGIETLVAESADGFITSGVEYQRMITRDDVTGATIVYYRGGIYTNWTVATSVVALIYTEMNYYVSDMDADDRRSAPQFSDTLVVP